MTVFGYADDLADLKTKYEAAVKKAIEPLNKVYENELQRLLEKYSKSGDLIKVEQITNELKQKNPDEKESKDDSFVSFLWKTPTGTIFSFEKNGTGHRQYGTDVTFIKWQKIGKYIKATGKETSTSGDSEWYFLFSELDGLFGTDKNTITKKISKHAK